MEELNFFDEIIFGNTIKDWIASIAIVVIAILLCKLLQLLNKKVFQKLASKTNNKFDDILFSSLEAPVLWGIMLVAIWVAVLRLDISGRVHDIMVKAYNILVVLNVTWFFARLLSSLFDESTKNAKKDAKTKKQLDRKFFPLVRRLILILIWTIGFIMALSNAGISVGALLGTLGIGGVAIALASQDTVKNILGGITIFIDQPFRLGDTININDIEGTVEDIGLRSTRIRTYDKRLVTIPNYKVMDASIINISKEPKRRIVMNIGLTYDTKPENMKEAIKILLNMPEKIDVLDKKDISANFSNFADSALVITYTYNIKKSADIGLTTSRVNFEILNEFNRTGLIFAYPSQTLYIQKEEDEIESSSENLQKENSKENIN